MAAIAFEHVRKEYPGQVAVADLSLQVAQHELMVLVGASGCGKSTTVRMANRLVEPTSGRIEVAGTDVARTDPVALRRRVGYVIQGVGLFPHRTVAQNVATVPRLLGWSRSRTFGRVTELLELVGLDPGTYARRYPHELSGGQQQRVGVARALAADPPVLLMDEPFGAVDPVGRRRLQDEFLALQRQLGTTVIMVTHDIDEAVRMADRVAVLSTGAHLEQLAPPLEVVARPASAVVSDLVGRGRVARLLSLGHLERQDVTATSGPAPSTPATSGTAVRLGDRLEEVLDTLLTTQGALTVLDADDRSVGHADATTVVRVLRRLGETEPDVS